ncbi:serine protease 1-like [Zeugodacus cucurbitae]|uniref:serine protease 1-like n=1 Tax=Zeugodacus cucurbitae TaxID=28588 RepID=UPI0023D936BA|nr:serine protease 1-like [Zeugodacus cucurbitae]
MKFIICFALTLAFTSAFVVPEYGPGGRITKGETAKPDQFPYQVGLQFYNGTENNGWCGGSIISNNWILTAAHCTVGSTSVTVYLGSNVRANPRVTRTAQQADIIAHPGFNFQSLQHDLAVIKIDPIEYAEDIQRVRLPTKPCLYSNLVGERAIIAGWGLDSAGTQPTNLQYAELNIISNALCRKTFNQYIDPTKICVATQNGESTCDGDSGGPLVLASSRVQIGIVSFGSSLGCSSPAPDVFTRVTSYMDWIKETTGVSD